MSISRLPVLVVALLLGSCGAGTAGVVAGSSSGGGGTTPNITAFQVLTPKVSPATLRLEASAGVQAELFYAIGGGSEVAMSKLVGVSGSTVQLASGVNEFGWNFADELGGSGFVDNVDIVARRSNGTMISGGTLRLGMGNDPPEVVSITPLTVTGEPFLEPGDQAEGNVEVVLGLRDSSEDQVTVQVEWRRSSDAADDWKPATVGGIPGGVGTSATGEFFSFFWRTTGDGLGTADDEFLLLVTVDDETLDNGTPVGVGSRVSPAFRIDNNEEPIVVLDTGPVLLNPDERRGIPIPFRVIDEEADLVDVIFQWRREGETYPSLPPEGAALDALLADPQQRREKHICTSYPHFAEGRVVPVDELRVRLPELAASQSWTLASGVMGRTLELLRPSSIPTRLTPTWPSQPNPLVFPTAALPVGGGLTAIVLDRPGTSRLREIELATGSVVREIATLGPGIPSAMTIERGAAAVLVALEDVAAGVQRIERVELSSGAPRRLILSPGGEPVRGLASLGTNALVFTAGSSLFHLDYRDPAAPQLGRLVGDLATPHGVVVDPLPPHRVYVSERGANRVLAIDIDSRGKLPVVVKTADLQAGTLDGPEALALERNGSRLLIVTNRPGGGHALMGLDLGATGGNRSFPIPIDEPMIMEVTSLATGADGLRLLCLPASHEILVAGGVEQERVIATYSTVSHEASVGAEAFRPVPRAGQPWRLADENRSSLLASAQGTARVFLWDSADAFTGLISLRATARDDEFGIAADAAAPKLVRGALEVDALTLGDEATTSRPISVAVADLDGDGDLDLVSANPGGDDLTIFFQDSPGSFPSAPSLRLGDSGTTDGAFSVAAADMDGDGDLDLVSANNGSSNLTVFLQDPPGCFPTAPSFAVGGAGATDRPRHLAAADLDGDGDLDLVSANGRGDDLTIFLQDPSGGFPTQPSFRLGDFNTDTPAEVVAADLDGDGDLDLVSANNRSSNLTVFFQDPPGNFDAAPSLTLGDALTTDGPISVVAADLDGDGDLDLVSANFFGDDLAVFLQDPPGSFATTPTFTLGGFPMTFAMASVAAADLDGDGDLDLVAASANNDNLTAFFQIAPGSFEATPLVFGDADTTFTPVSVVAADVDGDGDLDLVSANRDPNPANKAGSDLTIFFQASAGRFETAPLVLGASAENQDPVFVAAADLDQDGDLDLVFANRETHPSDDSTGSNLTVFFQLSPGSFALNRLRLGGPDTTDGPCSVAAADLDGDGDLDLVCANERGGNLTVFSQLSPGSFSSEPSFELGGSGTTDGTCSVVAADLDGDGDMDLVSANRDRNTLTVFLQDEVGGFPATPPLTTSAGPVSVAAADLDGDGDLDLVSANRDGDNLTVFFQDRSQNPPALFPTSPSLMLATSGGPVSVAAADLDGDGDMDLVSANNASSDLAVFFQLSPGVFEVAPFRLGDPVTTDGPVSVAVADLDGDGDLDIVSANERGRDLTAFFQLSPGAFEMAPLSLVAGAAFPTMVLAVDLDGDGDQDLVSGNRFNAPEARGNLAVFFGGR